MIFLCYGCRTTLILCKLIKTYNKVHMYIQKHNDYIDFPQITFHSLLSYFEYVIVLEIRIIKYLIYGKHSLKYGH